MKAFLKTIRVPGSKSVSNRVLFLAALGGEEVILENLLESDDTVHMRSVLRSFGVEFEEVEGALLVRPPARLQAEGEEVFIGNAGTVARFISAACLVVEGSYGLKGVDRMHERPQQDLFAALEGLGVQVECEGEPGFLPARFEGMGGCLPNREVILSGRVSSQFVSALLLVAPRIVGGLVVKMAEIPPSQPYVEMTLEILRQWGVTIEVADEGRVMKVAEGMKAPERYLIPADMSAASYPCAWATLVKQPLQIADWGEETLQGDEQFVEVCALFGADCERGEDGFRLRNFTEVQEDAQRSLDFSAMPDVAMTGMVIAAFYEGEWLFEGLESLRVKECDRIEAMRLGLEQLGVEVRVEGDEVMVRGGAYWMTPEKLTELKQREVETNSFDDHRIAMCFGVLRSVLMIRAEMATEETLFEIGESECVAKTWPNFWVEMRTWAEK